MAINTAENLHANPISVEKSVRADELRSLTSCQAGYIVPLAYVPLLREDRVSRGNVEVQFDMAETIHPLMNAVNVTVMAHFVSFAAFERFDGMDSFNRSYQGVAEAHNSTVIPFFPTIAFDPDAEFWRAIGMYWPDEAPINRAPMEAYNFLVNWRRRQRSEQLPQRTMTDASLAEAFWKNTNMNHVVPSFDQAAMDGEVELQFADNRIKIQGIRAYEGTGSPVPDLPAGPYYNNVNGSGHSQNISNPMYAVINYDNDVPRIYGEIADVGISLSLANIELAKQTAAFAKLREKYKQLEDDHIIDLLMEGIRVPDELMRQPILLDRKSTIFGYTERHAMDGASLDQSVTTGKTRVSLNFRTPPMNTGGVILITAEIVPEQLYERQRDMFLATTNPSTLPNFMRDYLDPEKVEIVENRYVDVLHGTPTAVFGYAGLNHAWKRSLTRTGGKFTRPNPDSFVEDRQRFWSVDQVNPTLANDFYMVSDLPNTVFADTISDAFEVLTLGAVSIVGNTVFGGALEEDLGAYDAIMDQVDTGRIEQ